MEADVRLMCCAVELCECVHLLCQQTASAPGEEASAGAGGNRAQTADTSSRKDQSSTALKAGSCSKGKSSSTRSSIMGLRPWLFLLGRDLVLAAEQRLDIWSAQGQGKAAEAGVGATRARSDTWRCTAQTSTLQDLIQYPDTALLPVVPYIQWLAAHLAFQVILSAELKQLQKF